MSVKYKIYQSKREGKSMDKWYARAVHDGCVDTNGLASIMQANSTVKRSDILAVLSELVETMTMELQNSQRVRLNGFGTFKIGLNTTGADRAKDFSVGKNVKRLHVLFMPEVKIDASGKRTQALISGTTLQEATPYDIDKEEQLDNDDELNP